MRVRPLFQISATIEILFGAALLAVPGRILGLLLGQASAPIGTGVARLLGIALVAFSVWAIEPRSAPGKPAARIGLCTYNLGAATALVLLGASGRASGILLWPAAVLHAAIGTAMLWVLQPRR